MIAPTNTTQNFVEAFSVSLEANRQYLLKVVNGEPNGTHRAWSGSVGVNGITILSPFTIESGGPGWSGVIEIRTLDTLTVSLQAPASSSAQFIVSVLAIADPTFTVFSEQFTRESGNPVTVTRYFTVPASAGTPQYWCFTNGNADGTRRVTSGDVYLNGDLILNSIGIASSASGMCHPATLQANDTLEVTLGGTPTSPVAFLDFRFTASDVTNPTITWTGPANNSFSNSSTVSASGTYSDQTATVIKVNGATATLGGGSSWSSTVSLTQEGNNTITVNAKDATGRSTDSVRTVIRDTQNPSLTLTSPAGNLATPNSSILYVGTLTDANAVTLNVNGTPITVTNGAFSQSVSLSAGANVLVLTATDAANNTSSITRTITLDATAPSLTISEPTNNSSTSNATVVVAGTVSDATAVTLTVNGVTTTITSGNYSREVPLVVGVNTIPVQATDAAGNVTTLTRTVTRTESGQSLPPDPSSVAPALNPALATGLFNSMEFLFTGENPIQTGVTANALSAMRMTVFRGRVLNRSAQAVTGATIKVLGRPEFGQTLSRSDGRFDIAANAGGQITIEASKAGYLSVQRRINSPWQNWVSLDSIVMVPYDTAVTVIDFSDPIEVARGSSVTDSDGTRRATLMFKQGTTTNIVMPNGSLQPVSTISVRATEFTVGDHGFAAMPANLPEVTAYTYAVELSVDEALAVGAREVQFSTPVSFYLENFLNMPVGAIVPVGVYNRMTGAWEPETDGRVIKIVSITNGVADIQVTSSGNAANQSVLDSLGFTTAERTQLASLYSVNATLWRSQHTHFTPIDLNFPWQVPGWSFPPAVDATRNNPDRYKRPCNRKNGSIIDCDNQSLGESFGIAGTPFTLNYASDRAHGYRADRRITIPAQDRTDTATIASQGWRRRNQMPSTVVKAVYRLEVAGQRIESAALNVSQSLPAVTLEWNGLDAAGRRVIGHAKAKLFLEFYYPNQYAVGIVGGGGGGSGGGGSGTSFASRPAGFAVAGQGRRTIGLVQAWEGTLGSWDARAQGFGGWSISGHHTYDPTSGTLYTGDGPRREARAFGQTVRTHTVAGSGVGSWDWATSPDNYLYMSAVGNLLTPFCIVVRHSTDGSTAATAVAGLLNSCGYDGEGITATSSKLNGPRGVAIGPDGLLYIADGSNHRIRRVDADGKLRTIAGTGTGVSSGDGGLALQAGVNVPSHLAFLPDGSLLFTENNIHKIRRIDPKGRVTTFAGTGTAGSTGDGGLAISATIRFGPIVTGPDGSVYIQDQNEGLVRRIFPDGSIATIAGRRTSSAGFTPATQVFLPGMQALALTPDGEIRIGRSDGKVYGVNEAGELRIVAGTVEFCPDIGPCVLPSAMMTGLATQFVFDQIHRLAVAPDGRLLVGDEDGKLRSVSPSLPGFNENDILVASEDGSLAYQFNKDGRHLRTLDAASRDTVLEFTYNGSGWLTSIKDADGLITTVERSGQSVSAIEGPFGQRTTFTLDTAGFLATVTNPKGDRVTLTTTSSTGLLSTMLDPRQGRYSFKYDSIGRLAIDTSAAGYVQTLSRAQTDTSATITLTDNLGRTNVYRTDWLGQDHSRSASTNAAGLVTVASIFANDSTVVTTPDSTTVMSVRVGDARFGAQSPVRRRIKVTLPSGLASVDSGGRSVALSDANDPLSLTTITDSVIINGRKFKSQYTRSTRTLVTTSAVGRTTTTLFDTAGRVIRSILPGVPTDTFSYDASGRLTQAKRGGRTSTFAYDNKGRLLSTTDALGRKDSLFYDNADQLTRRVLPGGREVTFAYDSSGNLTSVTPPGRPAHTFTYAPADRLSIYNPPSLGLPVSATSYGYNAAGQVTVIRRATGDSVRFTYDNPGRASSVIFDRGTIGFTYNGTTGNLASLSAPESLGLAFTYDGALPKSVTWSGAVSGSTAVTYNNDFRVASQTVNGANSVSFSYDNDGLLTQAGGLGLRRSASIGRVDADSITVSSATQKTAYSYDAQGALSALLATRGTDTLFATTYTRDSLSRITTLIERVNGVTDTLTYAYDSVGRLKTVTRDGTTTANFTYDSNGNRASKTTSGGTTNGTYDDQDRLTAYGSTTYQYTAHGDLRKKIVGADTTIYAYDALGNLTRIELPNDTTIEYLIDAQNRRIGRKVNGSLTRAWLYQGQLTPVAELDSAGNVVSRFVYATGANVPDYLVRNDSTYRIVRDHLGSVRLVVNVASGAIAQRMSYDEFGVVLEDTNAGWQPFGYAGGMIDPATGLVRFGSRDFEPNIGRWTAKDPIGFGGGTGNLYEYVQGDPVNLADASGLKPCGCPQAPDSGIGDWYGGVASALTMFVNWFTGTGPDYQVFADGSAESNNMRNAWRVNTAREYWYKNKAPNESLTNWDGEFGLGGLVRAGLDPTEQFVGSFRVDILPTGDGYIRFYVTNTTSMKSFLYGIGPAWKRSTFPLGGNMRQLYTWKERICP